MMEQWNDVQEKRGSDAEHRNQDKILLNPIFHHSIIRNTLALLKNRHMERTGHPIGDRLKLRQRASLQSDGLSAIIFSKI